jgi:NAD+ dependent glucose-6-phosphate dehydrogenase
VVRVLITGSTGNLGAKAVAALAGEPAVEIVRIGRNSAGEPGVISAQLETYDAGWTKHFEGADCVLHLAADPRPAGDWETIRPLTIDLSLNVLRAAEEHRVRRFVFASSNWVLGGYRFRGERLTSSLPPRPVNPYGASKLFIERYGLAWAARTGLSFLALRIGYCQRGENIPGPHMAFGRWGQEMWLGNRDWAQAVVKSATAPFEGAAVINIISRNAGMRWDLYEAHAAIGYEPAEAHTPVMNVGGRMKEIGARIRERLIPQGAPVAPFGARW